MALLNSFLLSLVCSSSAVNEHISLMPNPSMLGFLPIPLNQSYDDVPLAVKGKIPSYLNGTLYRGAPGAWPDGWWLDGLITLNAFKFSEGGKVFFSMKWSEDTVYNATLANHTVNASSPSSSSGTIPLSANGSWPAGVHFRQIQGKLMGTTGVSNMNEIDSDTLAPLQMPFHFDDDLGAPYYAPTHAPEIDGYVLHHFVRNVQEDPKMGPSGYTVTAVKPGSRTRDVLAEIDSPKASSWRGIASFQHQTSATPDYYVMLESPCYYPNSVKPVLGQVDWAGWRWNYLVGTHIRLVNRHTGESSIYPVSKNVFSIHHINAYQDAQRNTLVFDVVQTFPSFIPCSLAFKSQSVKDDIFNWKKLSMGQAGTVPVRFNIPLDKPGSKIHPETIGKAKGMEFPTISYDLHNGKPYQFMYGVWMSSGNAAYYDGLIKQDMQSGNYTTWTIPNQYPGEPIFVPDPDGLTEDDGVVMTNVLDTAKNETYLLILDAKTMTRVAHAGPTPHHIPHGYHGRYYNRALD